MRSASQIPHQAGDKRSLRDTLLLWGTAFLILILGAGFYWLSDAIHFTGQWRLYLLLNAAFSAVAIWRFRSRFQHKGSDHLLWVWLLAHWLAYALLTRVHFNMFACILLFPAEVQIMLAVGEVQRAKRREKILKSEM